MRISFKNLWTRQMDSWDPHTEGVYAYRWASPIKERSGTVRKGVSLSYGDISNPYYDLMAAYRGFAFALARFPQLRGDLVLCKVPCLFSSNDGHVQITRTVDDETAAIAAKYARNHNFYPDGTDNWIRKG